MSSSTVTPSDAHLVLVPWAVSLSPGCEHALPRLDEAGSLPYLRRLLGSLTRQRWLRGDEYQQATPHERFVARAMGWPDHDGDARMPWAALQARQDGLTVVDGEAWGLLSPGHWLMGRDHLTVLHPDELDLQDQESSTFFDAVRPLFESEGWRLHWGAATRWYAVHDDLADIPTASLDRVVGRNPDVWMPAHPRLRLIRRLQSEVQMMLYQHPLNEERERRGALSVNSFWLSGTGRALPSPPTSPVKVLAGPRHALLRDDFEGWLQAWAALDDTELRLACQALDRQENVELTLCGERHALTLSRPESASGGLRSLWHGLTRRWRPPSITPSSILTQL